VFNDLMGQDAHAYARPRRRAALLAACALATTVALAGGTGEAGATPKTIVLGAAAPATPSCPDSCQAIGKTTGFQNTIGRLKSPFAAPFTGKIVAWSIKLSRPSAKQIEFFEDFFDGTAQARVSVLKPIMKEQKRGRPVYKLKGQTPVEELAPFFGTTTTFALQAPLKVKRGQIVALTVPTWAPAFAVGLGGNTAWQASRKRNKCNKAADIQAGRAQQGLGTDRTYGCIYKTARLLYSATVVAQP
jgi:hypothetical protein